VPSLTHGTPWEDHQVPPPFVAVLRVYEPLSAFSTAEQRGWREYVRAGRAVPAGRGPGIERAAAWQAVGTGRSPRLEALPERASVLEHAGALLLCPFHTRRRAAEAALEARQGVPAGLADALVPPPVRQAAERTLAKLAGDSAEARQHVLVELWAPAIQWFLLFEPGERRIEGRTGARTVVFRTEMSRARRRAARALSVVRRALADLPAVEAVEELARWLEEFHPRSVVELDYAGIAGLLGEKGITEDTSAQDVTESVAALAVGDGARAGVSYQRVTDRWRAVRAAERNN
jgi:hypothetical protein